MQGSDGARDKVAATIGADAMQLGIDTVSAERALIGANPRIR